MTAWKQVMDEIETEAKEDGQEALDELNAFRQLYDKQRINHYIQSSNEELPSIPLPTDNRIGCDECFGEQPCLLDNFYKHQQTLPSYLRSNGAMVSCPCHKCRPGRL